ncbi:MAG: magnesium transporter [Eubacteriales bacterium]
MTNTKNMAIETVASGMCPDYRTEIAEILRSNLTPKLMRDRILDHHEKDIAAAMELLSGEERFRLYNILDTEALAGVLAYSEKRDDFLAELGIRRRVDILSRLEPADAAEYLQQVEKQERSVLMDLMDEEVRKEIALLCSFEEDEIGSQMTTNYISIRAGISVRQAMRELVAQAADNDNISTIYVVDEEETLIGAIDLKDLIIARENTPLEEITMTSYPYVYAVEQIEDCIERLKQYSEDSIPVLDGDSKLKGVLTAQDITRLVDQEMGDDYAKLAGLTAEEDLREPLKKSIGKRLPWLMVLLGLGIIVSGVVGLFEKVVAQLALIVCFQSLILDMAGNVGTQSLAITIRILTDGQLTGKQKLALVAKEARVGLCSGGILGILSFLVVGLYLFLLKGEPAALAFSVSLCTGSALLISMLLSSIVGTVIPLGFQKIKIDPAVASGPLITTVNDLVAVVAYYGMAWFFLIHTLHF